MTRKLKEFVNLQVPAHCDAETASFEPDHIVVLLALFNGADTLEEQLDSIAKQSHKNWSLIVSDDGSKDTGHAHLEKFASNHPGKSWLTEGPQKGSTQNFLTLISLAGPLVPYAALCDQDDKWLPPKLARAIYVLGEVQPGKPAVYVTPTIICDQHLKPLRRSTRFRRPPSFENALVQSIGGGNTMVLNRAALDLVQETTRHAANVKAHDWWIYQIVSGAGGVIKYDQLPLVLYRQHESNQVGANDGILASALRLSQLLKGRFKNWNSRNISALESANHWLTPEARRALSTFKTATQGKLKQRIRAMRYSGFYRQTTRGNFALWVAIILNKL